MTKVTYASLALISCVLSTRGQILNGSFENTQGTYVPNSGSFMEVGVGSTAIPGWKVISYSISWIPQPNPWQLTTPYGSMFLDLTGSHDNGFYGGISQSIATSPSQTYRLSLSLGSQQDQANLAGPMSVIVNAGASSQPFTLTPSGTGNQWGTFSFDFIATSSSTLISIAGTRSGGGAYLGLDNIQVTAVPEPSAFSVLLLGTMLLFARKRSCPAQP